MDNKISDLQKDMLAEIFNMGMGQAVNALANLSGKEYEVTFKIPTVDIIEKYEFYENICPHHNTGVIMQQYHGDLEGTAIMYYPELGGKELAKLLIGTDVPVDQMERLESDALTEVGNIFINSSLASLANFVKTEIKTCLPQIVFPDVLKKELDNSSGLVIQLNSTFEIEHLKIEGKLAFVLDNLSLKSLLDTIDNYLKGIG